MDCIICNVKLTKNQTRFCSVMCKSEYQRLKPKEIFDETKIYKCKFDGKEFSLGGLRSGALIKYSKNQLSKEFDLNDWEIIDKPNDTSERWNCPHCDWSGKTLNGRDNGGWVGNHLSKVHGIDKVEHVKQFPNDEKLWPVRLKRALNIEHLNKDEYNRIQCLECGEYFTTITNSHLKKKHNMSKNEYRKKHDLQILSSEDYRNRLSIQYYNNTNLLNSNSWRSKYEDELVNLFKSWDIEVETNNKQRIKTDLDLFLPKFNIAIEFDGLYYHSELGGGKLKMYHLNKTQLCEENGIHLIHIFEDEWVNNRKIVESRLGNLVGKSKYIVYARRCEIRELDYQTSSKFLTENHLQGSLTTSKVNLGLYHNNELVSVMTFGRPRQSTGNKNKIADSWEIQRFCNKIEYLVVGGASKLFKYFESKYNPKQVFSFADRRWTSTLKNSLYDELGLTLTSKGEPNYWYLVEPMKRHHRFNFTKGNIIKKFAHADKNKR